VPSLPLITGPADRRFHGVAPIRGNRHDTGVCPHAYGALVCPGVFRGLLDAGTKEVSDDVLVAAANALANIIGLDELNPTYIIPSVFNPDVTKVVAAAVRTAAISAMTPPTV